MPDAVEATPASESYSFVTGPGFPPLPRLPRLVSSMAAILAPVRFIMKQAADFGGTLSPGTVFGILADLLGARARRVPSSMPF